MFGRKPPRPDPPSEPNTATPMRDSASDAVLRPPPHSGMEEFNGESEDQQADRSTTSPLTDEAQLRQGLMKRALKWLSILEDKEAHDVDGSVYKVDSLQLQVDMFKVLAEFLVKNKRSKDEDEERAMAQVPGVVAMRQVIDAALDAKLGRHQGSRKTRVPTAEDKAREARISAAQRLSKDFNPRNARTFGAADDSALADALERGKQAFGYPQGWKEEEEADVNDA